jgi:hypothetical protein
MAPIAGFGAVQCLSSAAHENLGAHDRHLGKNEKMNFGAPAMQNCDSRLRHCLFRSCPRKRASRTPSSDIIALGPRFRGDERAWNREGRLCHTREIPRVRC